MPDGNGSQRRDLKKRQKAALYAKRFPNPEKGGRGKKTVTTDNSFTRPQLSNCRGILRHSAALLDDVIADRVPLDACSLLAYGYQPPRVYLVQ
jgi:hypothetical protein